MKRFAELALQLLDAQLGRNDARRVRGARRGQAALLLERAQLRQALLQLRHLSIPLLRGRPSFVARRAKLLMGRMRSFPEPLLCHLTIDLTVPLQGVECRPTFTYG